MSAAPVRAGFTPTALAPEVPDAPAASAPTPPAAAASGASPTASATASASYLRLASPAHHVDGAPQDVPPGGADLASGAAVGPSSGLSAGPSANVSSGAAPGALAQQSRGAAATLERISERLTRSLIDPAITDHDVRAVQRELDALPKSTLSEVLGALEARGLLQVFIAEQEPAEHRAFVARLEDAGILKRRADRPATGLLGPPTSPGMVALAAGAPPSLGDLVLRENMGLAVRFDAQRGAYLDRYLGAVNQARSPAELALLGPPVERTATDLGDLPAASLKVRRELRHLLGRGDTAAAFRAVNNRKAILANEIPPGHFRVEADAGLKTRGATLGASLQVGEAGVALTSELGTQLGPVAVGLDPTRGFERLTAPSDGAVAPLKELVDSVGGTGSVGGSIKPGGDSKHAIGLKASSDGTVTLERGAAQVRFNPQTGRVSAGLQRSLSVPGLGTLSGNARVSFQFSDPRNAEAIVKGPGMAPTPTELAAASPWHLLPPERQAELQRLGVRATYWDSLLPTLQPFTLR